MKKYSGGRVLHINMGMTRTVVKRNWKKKKSDYQSREEWNPADEYEMRRNMKVLKETDKKTSETPTALYSRKSETHLLKMNWKKHTIL
jgi:hypothetical protein